MRVMINFNYVEILLVRVAFVILCVAWADAKYGTHAISSV